MLCEEQPDIVLDKLNKNKCFTKEGYLLSKEAAKVLGLSYLGKTYYDPKHVCIAETNYYKKDGYPQHFFVYLSDKKIIDPLSGNTRKPYPIVSYRLFFRERRSLSNSLPLPKGIIKARKEHNKTVIEKVIECLKYLIDLFRGR